METARREQLRAQARAYFDGRDYRPIDATALGERLEAKEREHGELVELLFELQEAGVAVHVDGRGWCSPRKEGWVVGTLDVKRRGFGFVRPACPDGHGDVFIAPERLKDAHDGDLVLAKIRKPKRGSKSSRAAGADTREGRILLVLRRTRRALIGVYFKGEHGAGLVEPLLHESVREIYIPAGSSKGAKDGARVMARLSQGPTVGGYPPGEVVEILAKEGSWRADLQIIQAEYGIEESFSDEALREAERFPARVPPAERERRADLRGHTIFTIDPEDAKDFDDAVSLERTRDGGYLLGVFIADVSHYVRAGSALDRDAYKRGTSVYLPGKTIPMLPERLSNELCSLQPGVDRLVQAVWIEIAPDGELRSRRLEAAVIHSKRRFTYSEVQDLLDGAKPARGEAPLAELLFEMDRLRELLRAKRIEQGAIELDLEEQNIELDAEGEVVNVASRPRDRAHNLIEEFMLIANESVARIATEREIPIVRRVHAAPAEEDVESFLKFCRQIAPEVKARGASDFQKLIEGMRGKPLAPVVNYVLLRSLARAEYGAGKSLHYALAKDEYCHFTSPIRRYPDLYVHRALAGPLGGKPSAETAEILRQSDDLGRLARHCTDTERNAEEAEREMNKLRAISWLARRVGERFVGVITSVLDYGFFVRLDGNQIEGMVHVSALRDDLYVLKEALFMLRGRHKGRTFRVGDELLVEVMAADPLHRVVDLKYLHHRD